MSKHTPGPWRNECFAVFAADGTPIFHTGFGLLPPKRSEEAEANARLVAAAPALLASLKELVSLFDDGDAEVTNRRATEAGEVILRDAKAAIAKAEEA